MENKIIEKLKKGEVKMRPKWHFVLKAILLGLAIFFIALFSLFLFSFILFCFRPFPWILFFFLIILIVLLEYLFSKHSLAYKRPIIYSLIIIISLLFVIGLIINRVDFHERMEKRNLPGIHNIYKRYPKESIRNPKFEIKTRRRL